MFWQLFHEKNKDIECLYLHIVVGFRKEII